MRAKQETSKGSFAKVSGRKTISLVPVTAENETAVRAIQVHDHQNEFVNSAWWVIDRVTDPEEPPAIWENRVIMADDEVVGVLSLSREPSDPSKIWIRDRLVDKQHQGKGYGQGAFAVLFSQAADIYDCTELRSLTSTGNTVSEHAYQKIGAKIGSVQVEELDKAAQEMIVGEGSFYVIPKDKLKAAAQVMHQSIKKYGLTTNLSSGGPLFTSADLQPSAVSKIIPGASI
ncbi:MAG: GNAT family N-acetyltransferase [Alphaproteobacteria bacterium]|nr:GNAT family N-acetyltransferase [Alphaproteobacteria bacterium]